MFRKIEIWILYLTLLFSVLFAVGFGVLVRQELVGNSKVGWLSSTALTLSEIPMNLKKIFLNHGHNALKVEDRFPDLDGFVGAPNSKETYLLLSRYDGDIKESVVELVDLKTFRVLHTWNPDIDAFNELVEKVDEFKYLNRDNNNRRSLMGHPILLKDGGLLFQYKSPLRKIDACSNLVFQNTYDEFHHSIEADIDGNVWIQANYIPKVSHLRKLERPCCRRRF